MDVWMGRRRRGRNETGQSFKERAYFPRLNSEIGGMSAGSFARGATRACNFLRHTRERRRVSGTRPERSMSLAVDFFKRETPVAGEKSLHVVL